MQAKRFVAADMRRALSLVRDELGDDAMILSTHRGNKGVEIIATTEEVAVEQNILSTPRQSVFMSAKSEATKSAVSYTPSNVTETITQSNARGPASGKTQEELSLELEMARRRMLAVKKEENQTLGEWADKQVPIARPELMVEQTQHHTNSGSSISNKHGLTDTPHYTQTIDNPYADTDREDIRRLQDEIAEMRSAFETQLATMAEVQQQQFQQHQFKQDIIPVMTDVKQRLNQLGLTQACNDQVIRSLKSLDDHSLSADNLWKESLARLTRRIPSIDSDPVGTGGVYAFLGTTGVGKTTTIAKLAARHVIEHGAEQVALLTTDTFRIAAHDQLRSLGCILNVKVQVIDDLKQLPSILKKFSRQALVLIDTPGMSNNDPLLKAHLTALRQCRHVQNALVLSANSQYQMMQASLHSYRIANPRFCVMTKLDECASLGDAISLLTSNDLPIAYVTNGQAVPNDLAVIKPHQLLAKAVRLGRFPIINKASG